MTPLFYILQCTQCVYNECNESICTQKLHQDDFRILPNALSMTQMLIVLSLLVLDSDLWPVKMIRGRHPSHLRYHSIGLHYTLVYTAKIPSGDNLLAPFTFSHTYIHCTVVWLLASYYMYRMFLSTQLCIIGS